MKEIDMFELFFNILIDVNSLKVNSFHPIILEYMRLCCTELEYISYAVPFFPKSMLRIVPAMIYGEIQDREESIYGMIEDILPKMSLFKTTNRNGSNRNRPDIWFLLNGEMVPCEVKKNSFDKKAVEQLRRYMNYYGCQKGIAIASVLKHPLDEGMVFISLSDIYDNIFRANNYKEITATLERINKNMEKLYKSIDKARDENLLRSASA
jgi:hypothetical protein